MPQRILIIGGGISGLAAARRLWELDSSVEVKLFEAGDRVGGILQTSRQDGFLIEHSADMFTTKQPWALDLCRRIGLEEELIPTNRSKQKALVLCRGKLVPVPAGFTLMSPAKMLPILQTPLLSLKGKLRLGWERMIPPKKNHEDESLASFARRRFGDEAFERLIQPLIGGIYTADPARLSMAATLPRFLEMEQRHGSVIRAMRKEPPAAGEKNAGGARYDLFLAPKNGMSQLIDRLAEKLPAGVIECNSRVTAIHRAENNSWRVEIAGREPENFDALILAAPAPAAAKLLQAVDKSLAENLGAIPHAGASVVMLGYHRDQIAHPLDGFGFVVPAIEKRNILACSFSSNKFAGRAPENQVLLRTFVGGALQPELTDLDDAATLQLVRRELAEILGISGEPALALVQRWNNAMPQYHVGHLTLVEQIETQVITLPNFALAGNAYRGVGIPFCIRSGELAAERVWQ